jgi:ribosomal protein L29
MKKISFKGKTPAELAKLLAEKREELRTLRFSAAGARAQDPSKKGKIKADIARIMTELAA